VSRTPRPDGFITLDLRFEGDRCRGTVEVFVWHAKEQRLVGATNAVDLGP
jgi:hypothetical protein